MPHSEILGSKPVPGSPRLIAGYYVLHRLLLPRHPPNALLALDPIQKKIDFSWDTEVVMVNYVFTAHSSEKANIVCFPRHDHQIAAWLVFLTWKDCKSSRIASPHTHWRGLRHHAPRGIGRPKGCDCPSPGMMLTGEPVKTRNLRLVFLLS